MTKRSEINKAISLAAIVSFFLAFNGYIFPKVIFAEQEEIVVSWNDARQILAKNSLLSKVDRIQIDLFIEDNIESYEKDVLMEVSRKLEKKIRKDVFELEKLLSKLEAFSKNPYTQAVGTIKRNDILKVQKLFEKLEKERKFIKGNYQYFQSEMSNRHLIEGIQFNVKVLTGDKPFSIPNIWKSMNNMVVNPYQLWNQHFQVLEKKKKKYDRPSYGAKNYFSYDELKFYGDFKAIQSVLRRISAENSADF